MLRKHFYIGHEVISERKQTNVYLNKCGFTNNKQIELCWIIDIVNSQESTKNYCYTCRWTKHDASDTNTSIMSTRMSMNDGAKNTGAIMGII